MRKSTLPIIIGNLLGAFLGFIYFSYIETGFRNSSIGFYDYLYFVLATSLLFALTKFVGRRLFGSLSRIVDKKVSLNDLDMASLEKAKRNALNFVPLTAVMNLLTWLLAGILFGLLMPAIYQVSFGKSSITSVDGLRMFMGITFVGGSFTGLFVYFVTERTWRKNLSLFFPTGELSRVKAVFKFSVKTRLLIVFVMTSLVPLVLLGAGAYIRALELFSADPAVRSSSLSSLLRMIVFFVTVGGGASVGLSVLVSRSVSEPLQGMELAMKEVARGNFNVRVDVTSNDEIGALGEGFNRMIQGLKESESVKESFGKYVSKEIRDEILGGRVPLDGEMKRVTLLFSDLRDFTPFVESSQPKQVVAIMNRYFSEMTQAIKEYRGLVLQYVGDEIEAVFGAPVGYEDHPDMAVRAALEMRRRLTELNRSLEEQGCKSLRHGIGIHTGAALAGNIGSEERISYTLMGDTVNLASRISMLTKEFSWDIILSQTTHDLLAGSFKTEHLPPVRVKGKKDEVTVYRLVNSG